MMKLRMKKIVGGEPFYVVFEVAVKSKIDILYLLHKPSYKFEFTYLNGVAILKNEVLNINGRNFTQLKLSEDIQHKIEDYKHGTHKKPWWWDDG